MPDLVEEARRRIAEAADPARAPQMQAYMKSTMPLRGVPSAPLARLCRQVFDQHPLADRAAWQRAVLELWDEAGYREERYAALALAGHRRYRVHQDPAALSLYEYLVRTGGWWDYVDAIAAHRVGDILRSHPRETAPVLHGWAIDQDLWVRRAAILAQLASKADTDTGLLGFALEQNLEDSPHGREFFVRKAVGWALREHAKTDPEWVLAFVAAHDDEMSGLSRREALKHLRRRGLVPADG